MKKIIETEHITKKYGKKYSVKDLDLLVEPGSIYGFLGPNGAGKTTTLKMILGLVKPTSGTVKIFGQEADNHNRIALLKNIGSLIESPSYYGHLTGAENLKIVQTLRGLPASQVREVLKIVRLDKEKDKKVSQYSLGMKQRLGFATALLGFPRLLILDEPTNGLDPAGIQEMRELICTLPQKYDMTLIVSSHLLSEIDQIATDVGIIREGELIFQDHLSVLHGQKKHHLLLRTLENERAEKVLANIGVESQNKNSHLILPFLADQQISRCCQVLTEQNIGIVRIEEKQENLEQIFLELTGKAVSL